MDYTDLKVKIFADGATISEMLEAYKEGIVKGFTTKIFMIFRNEMHLISVNYSLDIMDKNQFLIQYTDFLYKELICVVFYSFIKSYFTHRITTQNKVWYNQLILVI